MYRTGNTSKKSITPQIRGNHKYFEKVSNIVTAVHDIEPPLLRLFIEVGPLYIVPTDPINRQFQQPTPVCLWNTVAFKGIASLYPTFTTEHWPSSPKTTKSEVFAFIGYNTAILIIGRDYYLIKRGNIHFFSTGQQAYCDPLGKGSDAVDSLFALFEKEDHFFLLEQANIKIQPLTANIEQRSNFYYLEKDNYEYHYHFLLEEKKKESLFSYYGRLQELYSIAKNKPATKAFEEEIGPKKLKVMESKEIERLYRGFLDDFAYEYTDKNGDPIGEVEYIYISEPKMPDPLWPILQKHAKIAVPTTIPLLLYQDAAWRALYRSIDQVYRAEKRRLERSDIEEIKREIEIERGTSAILRMFQQFQASALQPIRKKTPSNVKKIFPHLLKYANELIEAEKEG